MKAIRGYIQTKYIHTQRSKILRYLRMYRNLNEGMNAARNNIEGMNAARNNIEGMNPARNSVEGMNPTRTESKGQYYKIYFDNI